MANTEKIMVDIVFNPDTKQLEKKTTEITEKNKVKISFDKPDVKQLEGPFKELQEKAMAMANGGFSRGLGQLKEGVSEFGNIMKGGGDVSTAFAGGLSKIGMEGATALASVAAGSAAAVIGLVKLYDASTQQDIAFKNLGIDATEYARALNSAVNLEQAFAIQNAARNVGMRLNARELANAANYTEVLAQRSGDLQGSQKDMTEALQGNREAMYRLGIQYSETDTVAQRIAKTQRFIAEGLAKEGMAARGFLATIDVGAGRVATAIMAQLTSAREEYENLIISDQDRATRNAQTMEKNRSEAARLRRDSEDTENRDRLERMSIANQERLNMLAHDSIRVAQQGESTAQQITRSEVESLVIQEQINRIRQLTGGSDKERLARQTQIADLERREAAEITKRNQLQSFSVQLADAQRTRNVQIALAQANHTGQHVRQLSLAEQIKIAEKKRLEITTAIRLAGGQITEEQKRQLDQVQTFLNQGNAQQAQAASQEAATRRQNEQAELALRYANEEARARGETYRLDVDAINLNQRKLQIEAALNGLYAYRGNTANREAARLAEVQRRTQELQQINQIMQTQEQTTLARRLAAEAILDTIARSRAARGTEAVDISNREFANDQARLTMYDEIMQRQRDGARLTQSETQFLAQYNNAARDRVMLSGLLNAQIRQAELDSTNSKLTVQERLAAEEKLIQLRRQRVVLDRQEQERAISLTSRLGRTVEGLAGNYANVGDAMQGLAGGAMQNFAGAFSNLISTAIEGKTSFGDAMLEMTRSVLTSLSQQAAVQSLFQFAQALAHAAIGDYKGAGEAAASGALFAAVATAAGVGGAFVPKPAEKEKGGTRAGAGPSGGSGGYGGSSQQEARSSGPMVINFNVAPYSTKEDIEKSIATAVYGYENRIGRDYRSTRR